MKCHVRAWYHSVPFASTMFAAIALGCSQSPPPPETAEEATASRHDCPTHGLKLSVTDSADHGTVSRTITNIPIAPNIDEVPEYHDCQRLVRQFEPANYGPLVGIFAAEGLDTFFKVADGRGEPRDARALAEPKAVAQIFNYDTEAYGPLAIQREFSCLYLARQPNDTWVAHMVWAKGDEERCTQPLTAPNSSPPHRLDVFAEDPSHYAGESLTAEDIPPVARWQLDERGHHAIGIRCGDQWCTIVARGSKPEPGFPAAAAGQIAEKALSAGATQRQLSRVTQVRGWHDDQVLAVSDPGAPSGLAPRGPRARLFPHPLLGTWNDPADFGEWRTVAHALIVQGRPGKYADSLNLGTDPTEYELLHVNLGGPPPAEVGSLTCTASATGTWYMRMTRRSTVMYGCVTQRAHPEARQLPGTARWRWKVNDETMWVRCPGGCCTLER